MLPSRARKPASLGLASTARSAREMAVAVSLASSAAWARVASPMFDCRPCRRRSRRSWRGSNRGWRSPRRTPIIAIADNAVPRRSGLVMIYPFRLALGPALGARSAIPSSSGIAPSNSSRASVTSICAERPVTAHARRSFRWRAGSSRSVNAALPLVPGAARGAGARRGWTARGVSATTSATCSGASSCSKLDRARRFRPALRLRHR